MLTSGIGTWTLLPTLHLKNLKLKRAFVFNLCFFKFSFATHQFSIFELFHYQQGWLFILLQVHPTFYVFDCHVVLFLFLFLLMQVVGQLLERLAKDCDLANCLQVFLLFCHQAAAKNLLHTVYVAEALWEWKLIIDLVLHRTWTLLNRATFAYHHECSIFHEFNKSWPFRPVQLTDRKNVETLQPSPLQVSWSSS